MIELKDINKRFGKLEVLQHINLKLEKPNVTAVLGPNGSGKTTLLKCIMGLVIPDTGEILVNGQEAINHFEYRTNIAYLPQIADFPGYLTPNELFTLIQNIRGGQTRLEELIELFSIHNEVNKPFRNLSGGNQQKVNLCLALMYDLPIIILDEPSNGLDPLSLTRLKSFIETEKKREKQILLTTHIMSIVEDLADDVLFLLEGSIYYNGSIERLITQQQEANLELAIAHILEKS